MKEREREREREREGEKKEGEKKLLCRSLYVLGGTCALRQCSLGLCSVRDSLANSLRLRVAERGIRYGRAVNMYVSVGGDNGGMSGNEVLQVEYAIGK